MLALTIPMEASCAREHGVYLLNDDVRMYCGVLEYPYIHSDVIRITQYAMRNAQGTVADMLYREPEPSAVPVSRSGTVHVVSGVVFLPVVVARLLELSLFQPLDGCTYQGLDGGALPLQVRNRIVYLGTTVQYKCTVLHYY